MSPERWKQVEQVFQSALDLAPGERARFIDQTCDTDAELRREVEMLVEQYESAGDFIEEPAIAAHDLGEVLPTNLGTPASFADDPAIGRRIGSYKIVRELGRGGMGAVYLATRADSAFQKRVAIKLIKRGMDTDFILRRFRNERQILASLDHPNIARLLDGGTTDDGLPYFVMEYIEGQPLYRHCDRQKLSIVDRLKLFCQICAAVGYAHRNLIVHRDIKPGNILVTADGAPKLLDFGIAKLLNPELAADTIDPTATALRLMTPEYASPEQARGLAVTPTSDIYALGVLLYELLTGHKAHRFSSRAPHEIARAICENEPERPSQVVTHTTQLLPIENPKANEPDALEFLCEMRGGTIESLRRELAGDLDNIIMKAICKEPQRRYQSVQHLCEDITRHLEGRPTSAPSYFPAPARSSRQNTGEPVTGEKLIAVLPFKLVGVWSKTDADTGDDYLGVGLTDALVTHLSNLRRFTVRPTSSVLRYAADGIDPVTAGYELGVGYVIDGRIRRAGARVRVNVQLLDVENGATRWAGQFDEDFTDVLSLEDAISHQVTEALVPHLTGDERQQLAKRDTDNAEAHAWRLRGRYYWNQFTDESLPKAIESFQKAIRLDPNYALPYVDLADIYLWANIYGVVPPSECFTQARAHTRRALEIDNTMGEAYAALGLIEQNHFEWSEAERLLKRSIELDPHYPQAHEWYAALLVGTGRFDEGMKEMRRTEELDPLTLRTMTLAAWTTYQVGRFPDALAKAKQIIEIDKNYPQGYLQAGINLIQLGRAEEAVEHLRKGAAMMPNSALPKYALCHALAAANRPEEARAVLDEMLAMSARAYVKPYFLALAHFALGETERAFELFEKSVEEHEPWLIWFGTEPLLDPLRGDARFQELFQRTNNPLSKRQTLIAQSQQTRNTRQSGASEQASSERSKDERLKDEKSIAVLPLRLLGARANGDTGDDYLGLGFADALVSRLSSVQRFVVRPTSNLSRYGNSEVDPFTVGRELNVDYIVDGNIRRYGERIRVTAQLLSVRENSTAWSQSFDEVFTDVLKLEDSFARQVADALVPQLTGEERRRLAKRSTDDPEAFEAYLRGRYHWNTLTEEGFAKAIVNYYRAVEFDPGYAKAYAAISEYYSWLAIFGVLPPAECLASARENAQGAVELDPTLAEAHTALGLSLIGHESQWKVANVHHRRAIEINPNYAAAHIWYACQLAAEADFDLAVREAQRACELDPLNPFNLYNHAWCLYQARRYEECIARYRSLIRDDPRFAPAHFNLSWALRRTGAHEEAIKEAQTAVELTGGTTPHIVAALGAAYAESGREEEARVTIAELRGLSETRYVTPYHTALIHLHLGEREQTLDLLEETVEVGDPWSVWLGVEPQLDSLRAAPRFRALLHATKNPAANRA